VVLLGVLGIGGSRRRIGIALGTIAILFLLISLAAATPFFRLWFEVMPLAKQLRAPGMAFFLVAFPLAVFAGFGADRLFRREAPLTRGWIVAGLAGLLGLLGVIGIAQTFAEDMARGTGFEGRLELAIANVLALRLDAARLLAVTALTAGAVWAIARGLLVGPKAFAAVAITIVLDLWLVDRHYFVFSPPASVTYGRDEIMAKLGETPKPYRVLAPAGRAAGLNPYPDGWLMSAEIPTLFGYHGNQLRNFDDLLGGKLDWKNQLNPGMWPLLGIRYVVLNQPQELPGFKQILGPVTTRNSDRYGPAYLYEADTIPAYARVMAGAAKVPEEQLLATATDPRFPVDRLALYPDTASVSPAELDGQLPPPSVITAVVSEWRPGRMTVTLTGVSPKPEYLVVAENWYPDWRTTVDGQPATVLRAQNTLLSVVVPPNAKEVVFWIDSPRYRLGRLVSLVSLLGVMGLFGVSIAQSRARSNG
jgi:hypothetical protein